MSNLAATAEGAGGRQPAFFWLLAPDAAENGAAFADVMRDWTNYFLTAGGREARLPGHRGAAFERQRREAGIWISPAVETTLRALGDKLGAPLPVGTNP
jgi:LDH2 family malate/lactate/ureidoglycolate dehydrogenase